MKSGERICVLHNGKAFLPEVEAYRRYLITEGFLVDVARHGEKAVPVCDALILFPGWFPKWRRLPPVLIMDVNSRSTGRFRVLKDLVKRHLNAPPDIGLFLNEYTLKGSIAEKAPVRVRRGMGFFGEFLKPRATHPQFDVVYAGSLRREGVRDIILSIAQKGLKVAIASSDPIGGKSHNVFEFGRMEVDALYSLYSNSKVGLNAIPNTEPYAYQDSTKLIEYCAAGLGVLTTQYPWVLDFEQCRNGRFLYWDENLSSRDIMKFGYRIPDVRDLDWGEVMSESNLARHLRNALSSWRCG